jgi:hypothetical protein
VTAIETTVLGFTLRLAVPDTAVMLAVIVTVPAAVAVSKAAALIVAFWAGVALQVTDAVTLEDVPLLYCAVAPNCCVCPTIRVIEAGATAILVIATGGGADAEVPLLPPQPSRMRRKQ